MAQRRSRRDKGRKKQPELRTGGGRQAKAQRSAERDAAGARSAASGPAVRMRPPGASGWAVVLGIALLAVAAVAALGVYLERWNVVGYPDSLWLYVAIGCAVVAPAVGRVSRGPVDTDVWGLLTLVLAAGTFVAEAVFGPECPVGADCSTVGARGSLGLLASLVVIALLAFAAWGLARWMYRSAAARRPASGRVRARFAITAMLGVLLFPGTVVAAALVGTDLLTRDTPSLVSVAESEVLEDCFSLEDDPDLVVRSAPRGYNPDWRTFAIRQDGEDRPGVPKESEADAAATDDATAKDDAKTKDDAKAKDDAPPKVERDPLPSNWTTLDYVHPYEATVSFNANGESVHVTCRKVAAGEAEADDLVLPEPESNPMSPKTTGVEFLPRFFTQGVAGPSEEARKKQAEEAKQAAAKAKQDAAKDDDAAAGEDAEK